MIRGLSIPRWMSGRRAPLLLCGSIIPGIGRGFAPVCFELLLVKPRILRPEPFVFSKGPFQISLQGPEFLFGASLDMSVSE